MVASVGKIASPAQIGVTRKCRSRWLRPPATNAMPLKKRRFQGIFSCLTKGRSGNLADGEIRITGNRYENSLCRKLKCVALFDFGPSAVDRWNQFNNWSGWFGYQQEARVAVWLEIDRHAAAEKVKDAGEMHRIWQDNRSKRIIPGVESGHEGPVPLGSIGEVLLIDRHHQSTFALHDEVREGLLRSLDQFERSLPPVPDSFRIDGKPNRYPR